MPRPPSQLIEIAHGAIEFSMHGTGAAVLICHGTGGGYDQGLMIARLVDGFQAIAVSGAGYLRTPLETGRSPAELADAYASPLDARNLEQAAILGLSGGGMSTAHFALRHPDRCWGLILADAVAWLITRFAVHFVLPLLVRDVETRSMMRIFLENNPISERRLGVHNDLEQLHAIDGFGWENICVPTLLIHGDKDRLIPLEYSQEVARRIPNAELVVIHGGAHECLISHHRQVSPILRAVLTRAFERKSIHLEKSGSR